MTRILLYFNVSGSRGEIIFIQCGSRAEKVLDWGVDTGGPPGPKVLGWVGQKRGTCVPISVHVNERSCTRAHCVTKLCQCLKNPLF